MSAARTQIANAAGTSLIPTSGRLAHRRLVPLIFGALLAVVGCIESNPLEADVAESGSAPAEEAIEDHYLVMIDTTWVAKQGEDEIDAVIQEHGLTPSFVYRRAVTGFAARLTAPDIEALERDPRISHMEQDRVVTLTGRCGRDCPAESTSPSGDPPYTSSQASRQADLSIEAASRQVVPWNVSYVGGPFDGTGRRVWVIDSGIQYDHPDLAVDGSLSSEFLIGEVAEAGDALGHGTAVAGSIAALDNDIGVVGVAAGALLVALRVLDGHGTGSLSGLVAALDHAAGYARVGEVVVLSVTAGSSHVLDQAALRLAASGVRIVVAAGDGSRRVDADSPGRVDHANIVLVTAVDSKDFLAPFSNYGSPPVDLAAPGVSALTTWRGGDYTVADGTAVAAGHVAGLLLTGTVSPKRVALGDPDGDADPIAGR